MERRSRGWKQVQDPVHGLIDLHPLCVSVIDTYEFQRLRNISQCGLAHLVYPSACHSRFEHCIGVYYLACCMLERLEVTGVLIEESEKLAVMLAALCHDIGHGPFSHLWESFVSKTGSHFQHELVTIRLLDYLIEQNGLVDQFEKYGLDEEKRKLVGRLIFGQPMPELDDPQKNFLFEIVSHNTTGVDVDKWDYIMRDSLHFGFKTELNCQRILKSISVVESDGMTHIAFRDKVARNICDMFETREKLHQFCYQHRVNKTIETMLIDALVLTDEFYRVKDGNGKWYKLSECHDNLEVFVKLSDWLFYELLNSSDENLTQARTLIKRIVTRKFYTIICYNRLNDSSSKCEIDALRKGVKDMEVRFKESLRFCFIDASIDKQKLSNIFCFDRNGALIKFHEEVQSFGKYVLLMGLRCKDDMDAQLRKDIEESFCRLLHA